MEIGFKKAPYLNEGYRYLRKVKEQTRLLASSFFQNEYVRLQF